MKLGPIFPLLGTALLAGCAAIPPTPTAIGARDASGARTGTYRIVYGASGPEVAQGRFVRGKMDGRWSFFDSHHVQVAELTYRDGTMSGPYRTFFGSSLNPAAAGRPESEGQMHGGRVSGRHVGYDASGKVFTDAFVGTGGVGRVTTGTRAQAEQTVASDERFAATEEELIRPALP